ncbi:MAG: hypothetical protein ACRCST_01665 [Turicibacter sp.]
MRKYIILLTSVLVFIVGMSYYFEFTAIKNEQFKLYGFSCLILAVILGCSQLSYLPQKISNKLATFSILILIVLQAIPFIEWLTRLQEEAHLEDFELQFVELTSPVLIIIFSLIALICLCCLFIKSSKKRVKSK